MIKFINVSKEYEPGRKVISNIRFSIDKGEFVFVIGPSGAGKTTLMKLILKEEEATSGSIIVNGTDVTSISNRKIPYLRRNVGVVFQDDRLLANKTVYENVEFAMNIRGISPKEIRRRVPMVLSMVKLSDKANNFPDQLSGGQQQRVSIARAVVNRPPILIADEPTGNLDMRTAAEVMDVLKDINARGTTVLMATHDKHIVDKLEKRVIEIKNGRIARDEEKGKYGDEIPHY